MTRRDSDIGEILRETRRVLIQGGLGSDASVRLARSFRPDPPISPGTSNEFVIVAPGSDWQRTQGSNQFAGDSDLILDGQIFVSLWFRDDRDEAELDDSLMTDLAYGKPNRLTQLINAIDDDGGPRSNLLSSDGGSPLFEPLQLDAIQLPPRSRGFPWRAMHASFFCRYSLRRL